MGDEHAEVEAEALVLSVENRYPALYTISSYFRFIGWVVILGGILLSVIAGLVVGGAAGQDHRADSVIFAIIIVIGGSVTSIVQGIFVLAVADLILLLMDVERNTRASALNSAEMD